MVWCQGVADFEIAHIEAVLNFRQSQSGGRKRGTFTGLHVKTRARQSVAMTFLSCRFLFRHFVGSSRAALTHAQTAWLKSIVARQPLVLKASEFKHLFEEGPTEAIYNNTPVRALGQSQQGELLQEWARRVLQEKNPQFAFSDPEPGVCHNGSRRALHCAPYDFLMEGRRVEVKSARLSWDSYCQRWCTRFLNVKLPYRERTEAVFDDLFLVIMSPEGLHLIKHDGITGVGANGRATEVHGHRIQVSGKRANSLWNDALAQILQKLLDLGGCNLIAEGSFEALGFSKSLLAGEASQSSRAMANAGIPRHAMSCSKWGKQIQAMGFAIDQILNPHQEFALTMEGPLTCTQKRGTSNAPADWVRGLRRVELKSSGMRWDQGSRRWQCRFYCIKPGYFDELWLAICNPIGIHFYRAQDSASVDFGKSGAATEHRGLRKVVSARCHQDNQLEALETIGAKLISQGFEVIAIVIWDHQGSLPHQSEGAKVVRGCIGALGDKVTANFPFGAGH